jgi:Putative zinc-finger
MTCAQVRSLLAERSMGALTPTEAAEAERHLAWCAACRKEAGEMEAAAASLVYALAPQGPPEELEDRVVADIRTAVRSGVPASHRRGRMIVAATVAAMLAVAGLGFGAVMAGRAAQFRDQAITSKVANRQAEASFQQILQSLEFRDPRNKVKMADLAPTGGAPAGGTAWTLLTPSSPDIALVVLSAVRLDPGQLPLKVALIGPHSRLLIGRVAKPDSGGGATVAREVDSDLSIFDRVVVHDAKGALLLRGALTSQAFRSPSPAP